MICVSLDYLFLVLRLSFGHLVVQEWEGRMNIGMSNSVTTAIRGSVRDMAIGKTRTTEKADRATVEQVNNNDFINSGT